MNPAKESNSINVNDSDIIGAQIARAVKILWWFESEANWHKATQPILDIHEDAMKLVGQMYFGDFGKKSTAKLLRINSLGQLREIANPHRNTGLVLDWDRQVKWARSNSKNIMGQGYVERSMTLFLNSYLRFAEFLVRRFRNFD